MNKEVGKKVGDNVGKNMNKKGDFQMSFQFIFSIIIIIVVLFVGFYVIRMFLNQTEKIKLLDFTEQLKNSDGGLMDIWRQDSASQIISLPLSSKVLYAVFANVTTGCNTLPLGDCRNICSEISKKYGAQGGEYNMFFYPIGTAEKYGVKGAQFISCNDVGDTVKACIDLSTTRCIPIDNGRAKMRLLKENETSKIQIWPVLSATNVVGI
jgi:hypothetical protein